MFQLKLLTEDNAKILQLLKSGLKWIINWNKHHSKAKPQNATNPCLDFLLSDASFKGVSRFLFYHLMLLIIQQDTQDSIF